MKIHNLKRIAVIVFAICLAFLQAVPAGFAAAAPENKAQVQSVTAQPTKSATMEQQAVVQQPPVSQQRPATTTNFVMSSTALSNVVKDKPIVASPTIPIPPEVLVQQKIDQLTKEIADAARAVAEAMRNASRELEKAANFEYQSKVAQALGAQFQKQGDELMRRAQEALANNNKKLAAQLTAQANEAFRHKAEQLTKAANLFKAAETSKKAADAFMKIADRYQQLAASKTAERKVLQTAKPQVQHLYQEIADAARAAAEAMKMASQEFARAADFISQAHAAEVLAAQFGKQGMEFMRRAQEALANNNKKLAAQLTAQANEAFRHKAEQLTKAANLFKAAETSKKAADAFMKIADRYQQLAASKAKQLEMLLKSLGLS